MKFGVNLVCRARARVKWDIPGKRVYPTINHKYSMQNAFGLQLVAKPKLKVPHLFLPKPGDATRTITLILKST